MNHLSHLVELAMSYLDVEDPLLTFDHFQRAFKALSVDLIVQIGKGMPAFHGLAGNL